MTAHLAQLAQLVKDWPPRMLCPYYLTANQVPGANPDGRCNQGCSGEDGPLCLEQGPMTDAEVQAAAAYLLDHRTVEGT